MEDQIDLEQLKIEYGYTRDLAGDIISRMAGGALLDDMHRDEGYPEPAVVRLWAVENIDGFALKFERAEQMCAHALFEKAMRHAGLGREVRGQNTLSRDRLVLDAVNWETEKLYPNKFVQKNDLSKAPIPVHIKTTLDIKGADVSMEPYDVDVEMDDDGRVN